MKRTFYPILGIALCALPSSAFAHEPAPTYPSVPLVPLAPKVMAHLAPAAVGAAGTWTKSAHLRPTPGNAHEGMWMADFSYNGQGSTLPLAYIQKERWYMSGTWTAVSNSGSVFTWREWTVSSQGMISGSGSTGNGCMCTEQVTGYATITGVLANQNPPSSQPFTQRADPTEMPLTLTGTQIVVPYHFDPWINGSWNL